MDYNGRSGIHSGSRIPQDFFLQYACPFSNAGGDLRRCIWTGDGQIFCRAASLQYDVRQFFRKWLADVRAAQHENGWVPEVVPSLTAYKPGGGAWSDAVTIIPWQLYQTYGDISFLSDMYEAMEKWIRYIPMVSTTADLWTGCWTYGDWLALDWLGDYHPETIELSKRGYSNDDLICSAFYANSVNIVIRAEIILGGESRTVEKGRYLFGTAE